MTRHAWQASARKPRQTPSSYVGFERRSSALVTLVLARVKRDPKILLGLLGIHHVLYDNRRAVPAAVGTGRHFEHLVVYTNPVA